MSGPTDLFKELRRRNVFKVGAAYAIVSWLILQFASTTFPALQLPGWAFTLVTVLIFIGFPFSLLFAWAFELTPEGVKPTRKVAPEASITPQTGQTLNRVVIGLLALAVVVLAAAGLLARSGSAAGRHRRASGSGGFRGDQTGPRFRFQLRPPRRRLPIATQLPSCLLPIAAARKTMPSLLTVCTMTCSHNSPKFTPCGLSRGPRLRAIAIPKSPCE